MEDRIELVTTFQGGIPRKQVVEAIRYLRQDLDEAGLLGEAALSLLGDVCDYLDFNGVEKEMALGFVNGGKPKAVRVSET